MDFKDPDFLWATLDIAIWSDIECGLAITAGSLATLRPLYRSLALTLGFATTADMDPSKPTGLKSPGWTPSSPNRKKFGLTSTLFRTERGTVLDKDEEYGMGDMPPVRLRDDLYDGGAAPSERTEKGFNAWDIQVGSSMDEEALIAGKITMQKRISQLSERRASGKQ